MKHTETIKSVAVILLFCCMVTLAAFYIVNTQRLTMNGDSAVDINRLLIIRSGGGELTEYDRSLVMPEAICFTDDGVMYGCLSDADTLSDIYEIISQPLMKLLGPDSNASQCSADEADKVWSKYISADNLLYIRYHTPLPSPIIYAGLKGGTVSTPPEYASGEPVSIREMVIVLEDTDLGSSSAYEYYAAARDSAGNVTRYDLKTKRGTSFDLSELSGFKSSRTLVNCSFYTDTADTDYRLSLSPTTLITEANMSSRLITVTDAMTGGVSDLVLRLFGFNPDRLNTYTESSGVTVYVEPGSTLRYGGGILHFDASDQSASGIDITELLGYENYSGDYNVYELLCASGEFIRRIKTINPLLCGGSASMLLTDIEYENGSITIGFGLTFDGVMLYGTDYKPIRSLEVTYSGGRLTEAHLFTGTVNDTMSVIACFPQNWSMSGIAHRLGDDAVSQNAGDIKLAYIISNSTDAVAAFSSDWLYVRFGVQQG